MLDSQAGVLLDDRNFALPSCAPAFDLTLSKGLKAEYVEPADLTSPALMRTDPTVDFTWGRSSPDPKISAQRDSEETAPDTFSARWIGQLQAKFSETYIFHTVSDDDVRLRVNGQLLIEHWNDHSAVEDTGSIHLTANQSYDIRLEYCERGGDAIVQPLWSSSSQSKEIIPQSQFSPPLEQTLPGSAVQVVKQAKSASSFIDSLGIVTHLRYTDTSYGRYSDIVEPRLLELGIRHIRDGGNDPYLFEKLNRLANLGIRSTLVMDPRDGISHSNAIEIVKQVAASVEAVEGPNEWDVNLNLTYNG